jgi:hypothetical protein
LGGKGWAWWPMMTGREGKRVGEQVPEQLWRRRACGGEGEGGGLGGEWGAEGVMGVGGGGAQESFPRSVAERGCTPWSYKWKTADPIFFSASFFLGVEIRPATVFISCSHHQLILIQHSRG